MSLFLHNGKLLANSSGLAGSESCCCPPPPPLTPSICCRDSGVQNVSRVAFLEVEILNFTSSRGGFTDFDIAGPHLVPAEFPNAVSGVNCRIWDLVEETENQSMWESAFSGPMPRYRSIFSIDPSQVAGSCGVVAQAKTFPQDPNSFAPPGVVIPLEPLDGIPWVRTKRIRVTESGMSLLFQSRTSAFPDQLTGFSDGLNFPFDLSGSEFLRRACLRTLDHTRNRSGVLSPVGFKGGAWPGTQCFANSLGGTFSYTIRIRASELQ
jgi:hypothetical protein